MCGVLRYRAARATRQRRTNYRCSRSVSAGLVADREGELVSEHAEGAGKRATAYGMFAAVQGVAAVAGGALAGALSARSVSALVATVAVLQLAALVLLLRTLRTHRP